MIDSEIIYNIFRKKIKFKEIPVVENIRKDGKSSVRLIDSIFILLEIIIFLLIIEYLIIMKNRIKNAVILFKSLGKGILIMLVDRNYFPITKKKTDLLQKKLKNIILSKKFINSDSVLSFEKEFGKLNHNSFATGVSSASNGISALVDLICKKDFRSEIIIPAFAPVPVVMAIKNFGYKVKFADIDKETFLIDINQIIKNINKNTKIIMPVHLFGNVFDVKKLKRIINNKKIIIIEDASQAHFSKIDKKFSGSEGNASVFSFYPTKNLWALGDAGAVLTKNKKLSSALKSYRNYGLHPSKDEFINFGNNFRMDEFQAEVLKINLKEAIKLNKKRNLLANYYKKKLHDLPIKYQLINENVFNKLSCVLNFSK